MKKEIMKKWVSALKSKKYKQGKDCLHSQGKYCCLGVLCDLYNKDRVKNKKKSIIEQAPGEVFIYDGAIDVLPESVMKWAGMSTLTGNYYVEKKGVEYSLTELNDGGKRFSSLAKIIEDNYEQL